MEEVDVDSEAEVTERTVLAVADRYLLAHMYDVVHIYNVSYK